MSRIALLISAALLAVVIGVLPGCDDDNGTTPTRQNFPVTLLDEQLQTGVYRVCWDQTDGDGEQALAGVSYELVVICGESWDTLITLPIQGQGPTADPPGCDEPVGGGQVPKQYLAILSALEYGLGDTVGVDIYLPEPSSVRVVVDIRGFD